ncbi:hypothetical protein ALC53_08222, partial [Atta colombica]
TEEVQISDQKEDLFDGYVSNIETDNIREQKILSLLSFSNIINILDKKELHLPKWAYIKNINENIKFFLSKYNLMNNHENKYTVKEVVTHILAGMQIHNTIKNIEQLKESLFNRHNKCLLLIHTISKNV